MPKVKVKYVGKVRGGPVEPVEGKRPKDVERTPRFMVKTEGGETSFDPGQEKTLIVSEQELKDLRAGQMKDLVITEEDPKAGPDQRVVGAGVVVPGKPDKKLTNG